MLRQGLAQTHVFPSIDYHNRLRHAAFGRYGAPHPIDNPRTVQTIMVGATTHKNQNKSLLTVLSLAPVFPTSTGCTAHVCGPPRSQLQRSRVGLQCRGREKRLPFRILVDHPNFREKPLDSLPKRPSAWPSARMAARLPAVGPHRPPWRATVRAAP